MNSATRRFIEIQGRLIASLPDRSQLMNEWAQLELEAHNEGNAALEEMLKAIRNRVAVAGIFHSAADRRSG